MKLAVSNIAWENDELDDHLELLQWVRCHGIEIAPSCIWPEPLKATAAQRKALKEKIKSFGLEVVGLHSLLYTKPELELFGSDDSRWQMEKYLKGLFELCADLGGKTLVFGSPRNRRLHGRNPNECMPTAIEFFKRLMPDAKYYDVVFCIEALSTKETDFVTSSEEAFHLVEKVGHPNFGLHLDIKAMIDSKENFDEVFLKYAKILKHLHVGETGLVPPGTIGFDHKVVGQAVRRSGYNGFISIEMRRGFGPSRETIAKSIEYVKQCYPLNGV